VCRYQKGKTNLDFTEAIDSEWQRQQLGRVQVCTSLQTDNHASTPPRSFLQAGCPTCRPTNSVKALKASFEPLMPVQIVVLGPWLGPRQCRGCRSLVTPRACNVTRSTDRQTLIVSLVLSRLDYGNAVLAGLPVYVTPTTSPTHSASTGSGLRRECGSRRPCSCTRPLMELRRHT